MRNFTARPLISSLESFNTDESYRGRASRLAWLSVLCGLPIAPGDRLQRPAPSIFGEPGLPTASSARLIGLFVAARGRPRQPGLKIRLRSWKPQSVKVIPVLSSNSLHVLGLSKSDVSYSFVVRMEEFCLMLNRLMCFTSSTKTSIARMPRTRMHRSLIR